MRDTGSAVREFEETCYKKTGIKDVVLFYLLAELKLMPLKILSFVGAFSHIERAFSSLCLHLKIVQY
jgi:hypothetical protein